MFVCDLSHPLVHILYIARSDLLLTEAIEIHATEFAHDVHRRLVFVSFLLTFNPRSHGGDFMCFQILPVFAVHVAPLAIEVCRIISLVMLHFFLSVEVLVTPGIRALDLFQLAWKSYR